ncbi:hypothetical protein BC826DRAFT_1110724 [Russula brevipes]|nr:hypothetical protein BC826DRAFT_1110724 [Russula brevipes]
MTDAGFIAALVSPNVAAAIAQSDSPPASAQGYSLGHTAHPSGLSSVPHATPECAVQFWGIGGTSAYVPESQSQPQPSTYSNVWPRKEHRHRQRGQFPVPSLSAAANVLTRQFVTHGMSMPEPQPAPPPPTAGPSMTPRPPAPQGPPVIPHGMMPMPSPAPAGSMPFVRTGLNTSRTPHAAVMPPHGQTHGQSRTGGCWWGSRRDADGPAREEGACGDSEDEAARAFLKGTELADLLDEVDEAPQPRTVETMCKTEWPAQGRPTETEVTVLTERLERATMEKAATRVLEGEAAREEVIVSPKGPMASVDEDEAARVHLEGAELAVAGFAERACTPGPQRFGA